MSRIEKGSDTKDELQQLKGEVIKEISSQRKGRPWVACSLIALIFILGFLGAIAWGVAATGLVIVPGISSFAYQQPVPVRRVSPGVPMETVVDEYVQTTLAKRLQDGGGELKDRAISLRVSEASLTSSVRTLLSQEQDSFVGEDGSQITLDPDTGFTFFLPIKDAPSNTALQVSIFARAQDGTIELVPTQFRVGSLKVPTGLIAFFLQPFVHSKVASLQKALGSYIEIESLEYETGAVTVNGNLAVEIQKL